MSKPINELEGWVFEYLKNETGEDLTSEHLISNYIDSLDVMNIVMEAEDVFYPGKEIPDNVVREWIQNMGTIGEFIDNVHSYAVRLQT
jgi:acyl carrier protein